MLDDKLVEKVKAVKILIFDVDGVLTDGSIYYTDQGIEIKRFDVKDGFGIRMLKKGDIDVALVTARSSAALRKRAQNLEIKRVYQGTENKVEAFNKILDETWLTPEETAYVGDDLIDLPLLARAGFSISVADAAPEVRERVDYVTEARGGHGAAREITELILKVQGKWDPLVSKYLK